MSAKREPSPHGSVVALKECAVKPTIYQNVKIWGYGFGSRNEGSNAKFEAVRQLSSRIQYVQDVVVVRGDLKIRQ